MLSLHWRHPFRDYLKNENVDCLVQIQWIEETRERPVNFSVPPFITERIPIKLHRVFLHYTYWCWDAAVFGGWANDRLCGRSGAEIKRICHYGSTTLVLVLQRHLLLGARIQLAVRVILVFWHFSHGWFNCSRWHSNSVRAMTVWTDLFKVTPNGTSDCRIGRCFIPLTANSRPTSGPLEFQAGKLTLDQYFYLWAFAYWPILL
jgi:hypothetical protein